MTRFKYIGKLIVFIIAVFGIISSLVFICYYYANKKQLDEIEMYFNKNNIIYVVFMLIVFTIIAIGILFKFTKQRSSK